MGLLYFGQLDEPSRLECALKLFWPNLMWTPRQEITQDTIPASGSVWVECGGVRTLPACAISHDIRSWRHTWLVLTHSLCVCGTYVERKSDAAAELWPGPGVVSARAWARLFVAVRLLMPRLTNKHKHTHPHTIAYTHIKHLLKLQVKLTNYVRKLFCWQSEGQENWN